MRVLVTGATGFVGGHLIEHLADSGDVVVGLSRRGAWAPGLEHLGRLARLERHELGPGSRDELVGLLERKRPEVVYHLAAQANPRASEGDPLGTWEANVLGTFALLDALRRSAVGAVVVLVGSGVSYGNPAPEDLPVRESCPLRPNNPYAASKAAADLMGLQHHLQYSLDVRVARPFNHAGPRQEPRYVLASLVRQVAEVEVGRREAVEHGDLSIVRDFTDVRDIVRAYRLIAERGEPGAVYNVGTGRDQSLAEAFRILRGLARCEVPARADASRMRAVDQPRLLADASRLHEATGWTPRYRLEETLTDMLEEARGEVARGA
jgi:GDP-4-dehydro-6-deoxy-D-mannose reductase